MPANADDARGSGPVPDHEAELQTSAGRLHSLLKRLQAAGDGRTLLGAWATVFGVKPDDVPDVLERIAQTGRLVATVRRDIETHLHPRYHSFYLAQFVEVEHLVRAQHLAELANMPGRLSAPFFTQLYAAHIALAGANVLVGESAVPPDVLASFRARLEDLLNEVLADATLPPELKRLLVEHLEAMRRAVLGYEVDGVAGLEQAATFGLGMRLREDVVLRRAVAQDGGDPDHPAIPPAVQRTWSLSGWLNSCVAWVRSHPAESIQIALAMVQVGLDVAQMNAVTPVPMALPPLPDTQRLLPSGPPVDQGLTSV